MCDIIKAFTDEDLCGVVFYNKQDYINFSKRMANESAKKLKERLDEAHNE